MTFTRMDESTAQQWAHIGAEHVKNQGRVADRVLGMLRSLGDIVDGFSTDQLTHCLQTATRAWTRTHASSIAVGPGSLSANDSPTNGIRRASIPTTTRCHSNISSQR